MESFTRNWKPKLMNQEIEILRLTMDQY
jgi:hypothetical protein